MHLITLHYTNYTNNGNNNNYYYHNYKYNYNYTTFLRTLSRSRRLASFSTVCQLHFHVPREFVRKSLGSPFLGTVDATGDARGTDISVNMIVV